VSSGSAPPRPLGYQPGLDGLRAISVMAVLLYHAGITWLPGGFLGVEVFFVISGFLITSLLVEEYERTQRIGLKQFWMRRARRLLPALLFLLVVVCTYTALYLPDEAAKLRGDALAALTYCTNWYLIFSKQSYFAALGRPSLLRHLWSLAVEEQWYLVWPLVFAGAMRLVRGRAARLVIPIAAAALASTLLMRLLFVPDQDPSRVYYGTDTRASGLLIGAALACFWHPWRQRSRVAPVVPDFVGIAALVGIVLFALRSDEFAPFLYRGGFTLLSVVTVVLIAAVVHPNALVLRSVLGCAPLRWIGLRSYGIYLWHWPVYLVMRPQDLGFNDWRLLALRLLVTAALTEVSYRLIETPVRKGALGRAWRRVRLANGYQRAGLLGTTGVSVACVGIVLALVGVQLATAQTVDPFAGPTLVAEPPTASAAVAAPPLTTTTTAAAATPSVASTLANAPPPVAVTPPITVARLPRRVTIVGDSVGKMLVRNAPADAKQTFTMVDGAIEGCGIVDGSMRSSSHQRRTFTGCEGWPQRWAATVTATHADVALVSIGAWDVFDLVRDGVTLQFGTPASDTYLLGQIRSGVTALEGAGVQVGLLEVPCYRPVDGGGLKALPERGDDARTQHLNVLLRQVASENLGRVFFISGPQEYCNDPKVATDLNERWDGVHYYKPGAQRVWNTITPEVLAIPVP
jgi:peptidoglycan/LPS O-acetylase OafA/YrhL